MIRRLALATLAASALACGGQPVETAPVDGSAPPRDASGDVTAADAPVDAPGPVDAPAEVSPPDASHWCDTQEFIFCDDFDEYSLAQGWDGTDDESASLSLDGATYTSPAYAFVAATNAVSAGGVALGRLQKRVTDQVSEIHFAYDVRPEALDPSGAGVVLSTIELATAAGTAIDSVNVVLRAGGASVDDIGPPADGGPGFSASYPLSPAPALAAWTHVRIDIELPADASLGSGTITVYLGTATTPALDHAAMGPTSQPALPFFFLGAGVQGPSAATIVRFDDVTLDYL